MSNRKVRIGIDVGGTFTDAVAIDNSTYEIIAKEKIPTTHDTEEGVARGIINVIDTILTRNGISPDDVVFIAHGTTQATNALLEGDIAPVGIIGLGSGKFKAIRARQETNVKNIELAPGKYLRTFHRFVHSAKYENTIIEEFLNEFKKENVNVVVASESFGVDDPERERAIIEQSKSRGFMATAGHEMTQLYGLKRRTRTAVINGSLIPKMIETANMTETCIKKAGIKTQLMIMRCDGGVMSIDEVRKRPILTMLSGLAAGVAGALMYEKISDGIFFEVGGTSTDISVIKNGKVMIKYARVGGHKTYLNSLDIRTIGMAGGSMVRVVNNKITDVGPRSAHIAGRKYEVFVKGGEIKNPKIEYVSPAKDDPKDYVCFRAENGTAYTYTLAGAANIMNKIPEGDYALGNKEEAVKAWKALADTVGLSVEETARQVLETGCRKIKKIVDALIKEYELNPNIVRFVGGGGSAAVVVPYLAEMMGYKWAIAKNAPYISTIGVALAMVREIIEKTIINPTHQDIIDIRREVIEKIVLSGANAQTVEVTIEIDKRNNILRAVAMGSTELRAKDISVKSADVKSMEKITSESMGIPEENVSLKAHCGIWSIYCGDYTRKIFGGLVKKRMLPVRVLDHEGVIRLQKERGYVATSKIAHLSHNLSSFIDEHTTFSDAGATIPGVYLFYDQKVLDLTGLTAKEQVLSLSDIELSGISGDSDVAILGFRSN